MRAKQTATEHDEQVALFDWARRVGVRKYPDLAQMYAIPNGAKLKANRRRDGSRFSVEAAWLLAEGLRPGVPDIHLPIARSGWHSLYVEMKSSTGELSDSQVDVIPQLVEAGNLVVLADSWTLAVTFLEAYLRTEPWIVDTPAGSAPFERDDFECLAIKGGRGKSALEYRARTDLDRLRWRFPRR